MSPMDETPVKPPQFSLRALLLAPLVIGVLVWLYSTGLPADLLFFLLGVPVLMFLWLGLCRIASHFLSEFFD